MPRRHLIIGGGTAGLNAIRTIREEEPQESEITLVSAERPYSRMVLPYYLGATIAESHVYTATPATLARLERQALSRPPDQPARHRGERGHPRRWDDPRVRRLSDRDGLPGGPTSHPRR